MASNSAQYLSTLHKQINQYFSFNEIKTICFDLGVDYENIPGNIRSAFTRNLIVSLAKQNRLQELVDIVRGERPFLDWQDVPANFELPDAIAQEDIRQVTNYNVYYGTVHHGDVDNSTTTYNQQGQTVSGPQIITSGDANIGQVGDVIHGNQISVAQQSNDVHIQEMITKLNTYLGMTSGEYKNIADELATSVNIILAVAAQQPMNSSHLNLLWLGQAQLAQDLAVDVPGIEQRVAAFRTAVQQTNT